MKIQLNTNEGLNNCIM